MTVNSVNNYQQYRKEYIRLSTAINRGKEKGLDISKLFAQREQLKSVYSIQPNSIQSTVYNNERIHLPVNKVNKPQTVYQVNKNNEELKTLILELKSQLAQFSQLPAEIQTLKSELTELKNELVNLVTSSLTSKLTNPNSSLKKTASLTKKPTLTKLTPSE